MSNISFQSYNFKFSHVLVVIICYNIKIIILFFVAFFFTFYFCFVFKSKNITKILLNKLYIILVIFSCMDGFLCVCFIIVIFYIISIKINIL